MTQTPYKNVLSLAEAEYEVFICVGRGSTNAEIAAALGKSVTTVTNQIQAIKAKLGAKDVAKLRTYATEFRIWHDQNKVQRIPAALPKPGARFFFKKGE